MSTSVQVEALPAKRRTLPVLLATGALVGVADIVYAFVFYGTYGATPLRILRGIAYGLLGKSALTGGDGYAALGLSLHFFIAFSVTAFYFLLASRIPALNRHAVICGLCYGAGVFVFMHWVVIPLSAIGRSRLTLIPGVCEFVEHMVFVGLPASLAARSVFLTET